jgi:hypothetical protein
MGSLGERVVTALAGACLGLAGPSALGLAGPGAIGGAQAQERSAPFTTRAVQFRASAPLPGTIPFEQQPLGHDTGFEIVYLVEGRDLTGVKQDSLQLTSLRARDGSDLSLTRTGASPVELGPFPKATEDGRYLLFSVQSGQDLFGRVDERSLAGSVVVFTGSRRASAELSLSPTSPPQALGPFQVQPAAGATGTEMGVTVTGPMAALINALQIRDGRTVTAEQTSWDGSQKSFYFPAGADPHASASTTGRI